MKFIRKVIILVLVGICAFLLIEVKVQRIAYAQQYEQPAIQNGGTFGTGPSGLNQVQQTAEWMRQEAQRLGSQTGQLQQPIAQGQVQISEPSEPPENPEDFKQAAQGEESTQQRNFCKDPSWWQLPFCWIFDAIKSFIKWLIKLIFESIARLIVGIINLFNKILSLVADYLHELDPFSGGANSPVQILWNILKGFAYIIFSFAILAAGFMWILENESAALGLIFNIIIVALLINFTYALIKEAFLVVYSIEKGLTTTSLPAHQQSIGIGTLVYASLWQRNPFDDVKNAISGFEDFFAEIAATLAGYFFITVFAMGTFVILFVLSVILVARYIFIIFLTAVSPAAIASLALPRFQKVPLARILSQFNFFELWLEKLANWLVVVLVLVILVILGNVLTTNFLNDVAQMKSRGGGFHNVVEFVIAFIIIGGWYVLAVFIATKLAGKVGKFAVGAAFATLGFLPKAPVKALMKWQGHRIGGALTKIGELTSRLPVNRFTTPFINMGSKIRQMGESAIQSRFESEKKAAQFQMFNLLENFQKAQTNQQRQQYADQMINLIKKYRSNSVVGGGIAELLENAPQSVKDYLITNYGREIINPQLTQDLQKAIGKGLENASLEALRQIVTNQHLNLITQGGKIFEDSLRKRLENLSDADLIDTTLRNIQSGQLSKNFINDPNISPILRQALDKQTKGLLSALNNQNVRDVAVAYTNLSVEAWANAINIQNLTRQFGVDFNNALDRALKINPDNILSGGVIGDATTKDIIRGVIDQMVFMGQQRFDPNDPTMVREVMKRYGFNANQRRKLRAIA